MWGTAAFAKCINIGAECFIPFFGGDIAGLCIGALECSIIDKNIQSAKLGHGSLDQAAAMGFGLDVACNQNRPSACRFDPARRFLRILVLVQ